jgi:NAD(P)-dependent dehydrogenase (short-subunit alcohol dehydrogenase family)
MIVNVVAPGVMKTPMLAPETHEFLAELHPVGRMREIQDIVDAILFSGKRRYYHWGDGPSLLMRCTTAHARNGGRTGVCRQPRLFVDSTKRATSLRD